MQTLFSGIKSRVAPMGKSPAVRNMEKQAAQQNAQKATAQLAVQGVPGEYDFRKFLTDPLQNMVPVHYKTGGSVVGSLAVTTNSNQWRDQEFDPGRYGGVYAPAGEYAPPPLSLTILIQDLENGGYKPLEISTLPQVAVPPTKAVTVQKSTAKAFSINVLQSTDPA